jgi:hypothetical protein
MSCTEMFSHLDQECGGLYRRIEAEWIDREREVALIGQVMACRVVVGRPVSHCRIVWDGNVTLIRFEMDGRIV